MRQFFFGAAFGAAFTAVGIASWPSAPEAGEHRAVVGRAAPHSTTVSVGEGASAAVVPMGLKQEDRPSPLAPAVAPVPKSPTKDSAEALATPALTPVATQLSAEHAKALGASPDSKRPPTLAELHVQFLGERKDPTWAFDTEQSIRQAIAAANTSGEFDAPTVECRQSLCEILAFGNLPDSSRRWNQLWDAESQSPWHADIRGNSTSSTVQNGRYTIVTIFHRERR